MGAADGLRLRLERRMWLLLVLLPIRQAGHVKFALNSLSVLDNFFNLVYPFIVTRLGARVLGHPVQEYCLVPEVEIKGMLVLEVSTPGSGTFSTVFG